MMAIYLLQLNFHYAFIESDQLDLTELYQLPIALRDRHFRNEYFMVISEYSIICSLLSQSMNLRFFIFPFLPVQLISYDSSLNCSQQFPKGLPLISGESIQDISVFLS